MLVTGKLTLNAGRRNLKIVALLYRVSLIEGCIDGTAEILAIGYADSALFVYIYSEIPGNSLFLEANVPDRKSELLSDGGNYLPHGGYCISALAF